MSYDESARTVFANMLGTLDHLVMKAQDAGIGDSILSHQLADDMFPLELQIRVAINQVLLGINQVSSSSVPLEEETYASLQQVRERISVVRAIVDRDAMMKWAEPNSLVDLTLPNGTRFIMSAEEDIRDWILPNFYFHVTTSYILLRTAGLSIGKFDFLPHMNRYVTPGAI